MTAKRLVLLAMTAIMILSLAPVSRADISAAAVMYLKIPPGARAAGMGEAFVAVADDATATRWNPAGLGAYPLAHGWKVMDIPPVTDIAEVRTGVGRDYKAYEIWAIVRGSLARFDYKKWYDGEIYRTRTDHTLAKIVAATFNISDEDEIAARAHRVALANADKEPQYLEDIRTQILSAVPQEYDGRQVLTGYLDSLVAAFDLCLVNWEKVSELAKSTEKSFSDSIITETEADRLSFIAERARNRFLPEDIFIPYDIASSGELVDIVSSERNLIVGTTEGLVTYNGRRKLWQTITIDNGLPSNNILCVESNGHHVYVGTDQGLAYLAGLELKPPVAVEQLPPGPITAIGVGEGDKLWIVLSDDLYHFDGTNWSNSFGYTVAVDDTPERIAKKFSIYGTDQETEKYLAKLNKLLEETPILTKQPDEVADTALVSESGLDTVLAMVEEAEPEDESGETTASFDEVVDRLGLRAEIEDQITDDTQSDSTDALVETEIPDTQEGYVLEPGTQIRVPFLAELKGQVLAIRQSSDGRLWLGTEYGILSFNNRRWVMPGYRKMIVQEEQSLQDLAGMRSGLSETEESDYLTTLRDINDLSTGELIVGDTIRAYDNPAAEATRSIAERLAVVYFATSAGFLKYDGISWSRIPVAGIGSSEAVSIRCGDKELWFAGANKLVTRTNGRMEATLMHVNWLKELAPDMYYEFLSAVFPVEGWGTFGGNITYMTYGEMAHTDEDGNDLGTFSAYDGAVTLSYGTSLTNVLKGGMSVRFIYSHLSEVGAGKEKGSGITTGFALDFGLLYEYSSSVNLGLALTNLGPDLQYSQGAQRDPLPRTLAVGAAWKALQKDYYRLLLVGEFNKELIGLGDGFSDELAQIIYTGGGEMQWADLLAVRFGYRHDNEGKVWVFTTGLGLTVPVAFVEGQVRFDFAWVPPWKPPWIDESDWNDVLDNTLRVSLSMLR